MRNDHFAVAGKVIVARRWRSGPDDAAKGIAVNCWLDRKALTSLVNEGARTFPLETGGLLLGYWTQGEAVITDIIGPGPAAKHERFNFEPDYQWQGEEIGRFYKANEGRLTYLGDWHTHPAGPTKPSDLDVQALRNIADNEAARASRPLMLILGNHMDVFSLNCLVDKAVIPMDVQTFNFVKDW